MFELVCSLPTLRRPTRANFKLQQSSFKLQNSSMECPLFVSTENEQQYDSMMSKQPKLHLRGMMKFMPSWNKIIYICSPL